MAVALAVSIEQNLQTKFQQTSWLFFYLFDNDACKSLSESNLHWHPVAASFHMTNTFVCPLCECCLSVCHTGCHTFLSACPNGFAYFSHIWYCRDRDGGRIEKELSYALDIFGRSFASPKIWPIIPCFCVSLLFNTCNSILSSPFLSMLFFGLVFINSNTLTIHTHKQACMHYC